MTDLFLSPLFVAFALLAAIIALRYAIGVALWRLLARYRRGRERREPRPVYRFVRTADRSISRKVPRSVQFVRRRLSPRTFEGLPFTLICLAIAAMAILFGKIAGDVLEAEEVAILDADLLRSLDPLRGPPLLEIFRWITHLGGNPALVAATATGVALLWAARRRGLLIGALVAIGGSQVALWTAKFGFDRVRPEFLFEVSAHSPSFPSGHTTGAMAVYGFFAFAASRMSDSPQRRFEIGFWGAVIIMLVGFSRIYLHVHFPSDVAAGLLVGGIWLLLGVAVSLWLDRSQQVSGDTAKDARPMQDG